MLFHKPLIETVCKVHSQNSPPFNQNRSTLIPRAMRDDRNPGFGTKCLEAGANEIFSEKHFNPLFL